MTDYQAVVADLFGQGFTDKQIAPHAGGTPDGVRSTRRKLARRGLLPVRQRIEWPVPGVGR